MLQALIGCLPELFDCGEIDGIWNYDSSDYLFMSEFRFNKTAKAVSIMFKDQSVINV